MKKWLITIVCIAAVAFMACGCGPKTRQSDKSAGSDASATEGIDSKEYGTTTLVITGSTIESNAAKSSLSGQTDSSSVNNNSSSHKGFKTTVSQSNSTGRNNSGTTSSRTDRELGQTTTTVTTTTTTADNSQGKWSDFV